MRLMDVGEFGLIERIARRSAKGKGVRLGIGDDAAAVEATPGHLTLVTTDMLVEDIHFDLSFTTPNQLGRKSLAVNLSDIAAMGGKPRHVLLALALPRGTTVEFVDAFMDGMLELAAEFDVALIGGDTCASATGLTVSITAMGEQLPERILRRDSARPGDLVFVTGTLGDSALGLKLLRQGFREGGAIERHLSPTPRVREGIELAVSGYPSAMIDISDGLLADLGHILRLSRVGADLELMRLPLSSDLHVALSLQADDPFALPLAGGEDYELLFTAPPTAEEAIYSLLARCGTPVSVIGRISAESGMRVVAADGSEYQPRRHGYNHFSPPGSQRCQSV